MDVDVRRGGATVQTAGGLCISTSARVGALFFTDKAREEVSQHPLSDVHYLGG